MLKRLAEKFGGKGAASRISRKAGDSARHQLT
jgi:hypothetical protein